MEEAIHAAKRPAQLAPVGRAGDDDLDVKVEDRVQRRVLGHRHAHGVAAHHERRVTPNRRARWRR